MRLHATRGAYAARCAQYVPKSGRSALDHLSNIPWSRSFFDTALRFFLLADDALRVNPEEDAYAMTGPVGDLGTGHSSVEPGRDGRVPKIIRPPGQQ